MNTLNYFTLTTLLLLAIGSVHAQSLLDVGFGSSQQDDVALQIAYGKQVNERLRAGIQFQYGMPNYRFISAITFEDKGYSTAIAIPITYRINSENAMQLSLFVKPGLRLQGVDAAETNNISGDYMSTAITFEPGLLVHIPVGDKLGFQSGVTFPIFYEIKPTVLFENQTTLLHAGASYRVLEHGYLYVKSNMGSAWGASGDSQKFLWSAQLGVRLVLGKNKSNAFNPIIESAL